MIKTIPSHPHYGCDALGNVYKMTGPHPMILKTSERGGSSKAVRYNSVYISKVGSKYVHKLIAETWFSGWNPSLHVDHINGIRKDNRAVNLRCLTAAENAQNSNSLGVSKQTKGFQASISFPKLTGKGRKLVVKKRVDEEKAWQVRVDLVDQHYKYNWINDALRDIRTDGIWIFIHKLTTYQYNLDPKYIDRLLAGVSIYNPPRKKTKKK